MNMNSCLHLGSLEYIYHIFIVLQDDTTCHQNIPNWDIPIVYVVIT